MNSAKCSTNSIVATRFLLKREGLGWDSPSRRVLLRCMEDRSGWKAPLARGAGSRSPCRSSPRPPRPLHPSFFILAHSVSPVGCIREDKPSIRFDTAESVVPIGLSPCVFLSQTFSSRNQQVSHVGLNPMSTPPDGMVVAEYRSEK